MKRFHKSTSARKNWLTHRVDSKLSPHYISKQFRPHPNGKPFHFEKVQLDFENSPSNAMSRSKLVCVVHVKRKIVRNSTGYILCMRSNLFVIRKYQHNRFVTRKSVRNAFTKICARSKFNFIFRCSIPKIAEMRLMRANMNHDVND